MISEFSYLVLEGFVPPQIDKYAFVRHGHVQSDASCFQTGKQYSSFWIPPKISQVFLAGMNGHFSGPLDRISLLKRMISCGTYTCKRPSFLLTHDGQNSDKIQELSENNDLDV